MYTFICINEYIHLQILAYTSSRFYHPNLFYPVFLLHCIMQYKISVDVKDLHKSKLCPFLLYDCFPFSFYSFAALNNFQNQKQI